MNKKKQKMIYDIPNPTAKIYTTIKNIFQFCSLSSSIFFMSVYNPLINTLATKIIV